MDDFGRPQVYPSGLQKVIAVGRNTFGELGLGFSSQESTWGMVSGGFEGQGGITGLQCGLGSSWLITANDGGEHASSLVYAFGSESIDTFARDFELTAVSQTIPLVNLASEATLDRTP